MENLPLQRNAELLKKSAFALLFVGVLITLLGGIFMLRVPLYSGARFILYAGYGAFVLAQLGAMAFVLAAPMMHVNAVVSAITRLLAHPRLALVLSVAILVCAAVEVEIINIFVPKRSAAILILTIGWGALLIVALAISNTPAIEAFLGRTRGLWVGVGVFVTIVLTICLIFGAVDVAIHDTTLFNRLRGAEAYRPLTFYGNETRQDWAQTYWSELTNLQFTWLPYVYVGTHPFRGQFINIDDQGRRATASFVTNSNPAPNVFFFGGSTMWGYGSRDNYTLPSQIARMLKSENVPIRATNYAQQAYVSTQELILFQRQLALGNVPNVAVFYDGYNDLLAVDLNDNIAGLPHNEINRQRDLLSGQFLRNNQRPLLREPGADFSDLNISLVGIPNASPDQVVDLYLQNVRQARTLAREYAVQTLFVWQPGILFKQPLTTQEQSLVDRYYHGNPDFETLYRSADQELRRRIQTERLTDILILSDLFAHDSRNLFIDPVHMTEDANAVIAEAIATQLLPLLQ